MKAKKLEGESGGMAIVAQWVNHCLGCMCPVFAYLTPAYFVSDPTDYLIPTWEAAGDGPGGSVPATHKGGLKFLDSDRHLGSETQAEGYLL